METRFRDVKTLAAHPIMALRVKQDTVVGMFRTTPHQRDAVMKTPAGEPGDFLIADDAKTALLQPEKAKSTSPPERFQHMRLFTVIEVGFIRGIVGIGFAFHLDVSFDGYVTGELQPDLAGLPLVVAGFTEEHPVACLALGKVLLFDPTPRLFRVPSSRPSPQTSEDDPIHVLKDSLAYHVSMIVGPTS